MHCVFSIPDSVQSGNYPTLTRNEKRFKKAIESDNVVNHYRHSWIDGKESSTGKIIKSTFRLKLYPITSTFPSLIPMELIEIVEKMAKALIVVDSSTKTQRASRSDSGNYIPCVGTIWESDFTQEAVIRWALNYPEDFAGFTDDWFEVSYPTGRGRCDLVLTGIDFKPEFGLAPYEWAIENKYVRFIGDNGKNNDYGVTKVVSPYRKDRSSVLDAERLKTFTLAERKAILMYGFEFDSDSHSLALAWCDEHENDGDQSKNRERVKNMKSILDKADPKTHEMSMRDLIPLFEAAAKTKGIKLGPCYEKEFSGLDRHPLYHRGRILAWEVLE